MKLSEVQFGSRVRDRITLVEGIVTAKYEKESGAHQVLIEGMDTTGRAFDEWIEISRVVLK